MLELALPPPSNGAGGSGGAFPADHPGPSREPTATSVMDGPGGPAYTPLGDGGDGGAQAVRGGGAKQGGGGGSGRESPAGGGLSYPRPAVLLARGDDGAMGAAPPPAESVARSRPGLRPVRPPGRSQWGTGRAYAPRSAVPRARRLAAASAARLGSRPR